MEQQPPEWTPPDVSRPYPPPSDPQPSYPPPAYAPPGYAPPGHPQAPPSTNGFAIASLIFGLLGGVLLSVIFGIVALRQIPRYGQKGKRLAVAGLVLSGLWLVLIVVGVVWAITSGAQRDVSGEITGGGDISLAEIEFGDCLTGLQEDDAVLSVAAVPCRQSHEGEVFAIFDLDAGRWEGVEAVASQAERGCLERMEQKFPDLYADESVEVFFFHPTEDSWRIDDRQVACVALPPGGRASGSMLE